SGYSFSGQVAGDGNDQLRLGGTVNAQFNASQIGSQFTGFGSVAVNGTATWSVYGSSSLAWSVAAGGGLQTTTGNALSLTSTLNN
ncbi:hypothetical protein, partial [Serratia marcescens]|uniref:hypothetical protein n=1 Tax=Serratia marcescens TaxID=615 RepID=UPI0013D90352